MSKNTRRGAPEIWSNPTAARTRPRQIEKIVFGMSSPPRPTKVAKARSIRAKISGGPKAQGDRGQKRCESGEQDVCHAAADEGRDRGGHKGQTGPALQRKWSSVECRGHRRRGTGDSKRDRTDGATIHRAVIDRRQKDDRRSRRHQKGDRQQDRDPVDRAETRHRTDEETQGSPRSGSRRGSAAVPRPTYRHQEGQVFPSEGSSLL